MIDKTKLRETINKLRELTTINTINSWYYFDGDLPNTPSDFQSWQSWEIAQPNTKNYITWSGGRKVCWLAQKLIIPENLQGYPLESLSLRLKLTWWAELAEIFVNNKLIQVGDLFNSSARILLSNSVIPKQEITVTIRLISPSHDIGALMESVCLYEASNDANANFFTPGWVADELTVLSNYLEAFEPDKIPLLITATNLINWDHKSNSHLFSQSLSTLREAIQPLAINLKKRCINLLGHAHLDLAWLWTINETYIVAEQTFKSVLNLQKEWEYLTFCHTTPALYSWLEKNQPDLFEDIQNAVKQGKWEALGGMWVEPDTNLPDGESLIRQLLYGQLYTQKKFDSITEIAWLPDTFGFTWQLPQILEKSGIKYFVTGKLHWNDTTKFPHGFFWWRAPNGSKILALISPPNVAGVMDTNPIIMSNYAISWEKQTGLQDIFWLPGIGNHGGGPTRDMLEVQEKWQNSPFFPKLKFTTAIDYLETIKTSFQESINTPTKSDIPIWNDELYLEFHRGCYTTHSEQKYFNRDCEKLLYQAELFLSISKIISEKSRLNSNNNYLNQTNNQTYLEKQERITELWKLVLFNQFHDILPGTSINEVFVDANEKWKQVKQEGEKILEECLENLASKINLSNPPHPQAKPLIVFNPLNWQREEVVSFEIEGNIEGNWDIYNTEGEKILSQQIDNNHNNTGKNTYLFLAEDIPSIGYRLFWLSPSQTKLQNENLVSSEFILENDFLKVIVDRQTGDLASIFDKIAKREVLAGAGNQLQSFKDEGQYWDAWNIDPNYHKYPLPPTKLKSIQQLETGPIQWRVRVIRELGKSEFQQDYILPINSPILKVKNLVNWQEEKVLVKAVFPLNIKTELATYEIPCGTIQRKTNPQTEAEQAKWELPALRWACLTEENPINKVKYGVSLLNDCKYGYDCQESQIRLSLLRSPKWPDTEADMGIHEFTYGIYPHQGDWIEGKTVHKGYEFNLDLIPFILENHHLKINQQIDKQQKNKNLPSVGKFLDLGRENLILIALKQPEDKYQDQSQDDSQDDSKTLILRCYECYGENAFLSINGDLGLKISSKVDLLERNLFESEETLMINPYSIDTYKVEF